MAQQVQKPLFKKFDASSYRVGIVVAQFNRDVTEKLFENAKVMLATYKVPEENVATKQVAGSIEVPVILKHLADSGKYDCLVAIGAVVRGETAHFDYVCKIVSEGILRVQLDFGIPIGFGVLTTDNHEQAMARIGTGGEAVEAALQSAKLIKEIKR